MLYFISRCQSGFIDKTIASQIQDLNSADGWMDGLLIFVLLFCSPKRTSTCQLLKNSDMTFCFFIFLSTFSNPAHLTMSSLTTWQSWVFRSVEFLLPASCGSLDFFYELTIECSNIKHNQRQPHRIINYQVIFSIKFIHFHKQSFSCANILWFMHTRVF